MVLVGCEPQYNHDQPDTAANRQGFEKHLGVPASDAVSNVYYYADALGADSTYQLGFTATPDIIKQIVTELNLVATDPNTDGLIGRDFDWWIAEEIVRLPMYCRKTEGKEHYRCLWYAEKTKQAYYLEYSL